MNPTIETATTDLNPLRAAPGRGDLSGGSDLRQDGGDRGVVGIALALGQPVEGGKVAAELRCRALVHPVADVGAIAPDPDEEAIAVDVEVDRQALLARRPDAGGGGREGGG